MNNELNKKVLEDFKRQTSISNFKKEAHMENKKQTNKFKIINIAAIVLIIFMIGIATPSIYAKIQWNIQFNEYQNREYEIGGGTIKEAIESGYNEEVEMDYITQDGISVKVDSLIITDDYLESKINFKFADNIELNSETFGFGFAVYDDQKNIYGIFTRMHLGSNEKYDTYTPYMYKEIGVEYNKNDIYAIQLNDSEGHGNVSATDRNIISKLEMRSSKGFPKSNKIYIRIFDLGYYMLDMDYINSKPKTLENFDLSDAEWIFEIEVPDKFYNRQTTTLELKNEIPGLEIETITVTEVGLVVRAKIEGINDIISLGKDISGEEWTKLRNETINITDGDGNIYYENSMGTLEKKDWIKVSYEINKNMLNKNLFLNIKINGQQYTSELIKK